MQTRSKPMSSSNLTDPIATQLAIIASKLDGIVSELKSDVATLKSVMFGTPLRCNNHVESGSGSSNRTSGAKPLLSTTETLVNTFPCSHVVPKPTHKQAPLPTPCATTLTPTITPKLGLLLVTSMPPLAGSVKQQLTISKCTDSVQAGTFILREADVVLGIRWLTTFDTIQATWKKQIFMFKHKGQKYKPQGLSPDIQNSATFHHMTIEPFDEQSIGLTAPFSVTRLEDKSCLRAASIDTNPSPAVCNDTNPLLGSNGLEQTHSLLDRGKRVGGRLIGGKEFEIQNVGGSPRNQEVGQQPSNCSHPILV